MSNKLRLCAKCLIFMRISLLYRISLFAGLSVHTSLSLRSFYYCCCVCGKRSIKWLFRFASWRANLQMEIRAFVTELELCNSFHSPCSQLFKSLSYIHSNSVYQKAPTAQQASNKNINMYLKHFTSCCVDIQLKKGHEITAHTIFFGPYSKDDFRGIIAQPTLAEYETSSMIFFLLNQNKLLWTHQYHRCWFLLVYLLDWIEAKASPNLTNNTNISKKNASAKKQTFVHALAEHFPSRSPVIILPLTKSHRTEDERKTVSTSSDGPRMKFDKFFLVKISNHRFTW